MKVLLDVNIFMDVLQARRGVQASLKVISLLQKPGEHRGYVSVLTIPILYYLLISRDYSDQEARACVQRITQGFIPVNLTGKLIQKAFVEDKIPDFEDCIQYHSAKATGCQAIVTRNTQDFRKIELEVYTPEGFLQVVTPAQKSKPAHTFSP